MTRTTSPNNANLVPSISASSAPTEGPIPNPTQVVATANAPLIANQATTAATLAAFIPTASIFATVATANNHHRQQVHTPSQQVAAAVVAVAAALSQWNKDRTVVPVISFIGNNTGRTDAYEQSGGTNSTEERRAAERLNRRGVFNEGRHKDVRVNNQRNNGRNKRDLIVAQRRQRSFYTYYWRLPQSARFTNYCTKSKYVGQH